MRLEPELTVRALLVGAGTGLVLLVTNLYVGLKTGWWDGGSVTAAIVGFAILGRARTPYSPLENNVSQATASSVAAMPATAGLLGSLPALQLVGQRVPTLPLIAWAIAVGVVGVLAATVLARRLIVAEKLPFPTGIATAQVITAMHAAGGRRDGRARVLVSFAALSGAVAWLRDGVPALLPQMVALPGRILGVLCAELTLGVAWSPVMAGAGALVGVRLAASIALGAALAWIGGAPWLWRSHRVADTDFASFERWLIWPGVGLVVGAAAAHLPGALAAIRSTLRPASRAGSPARRPSWSLALFAAALLVVIWMSHRLFAVSPLVTIAALALSLVAMEVCGRVAGTSDFAPIGTMGQLTQALAPTVGVHGAVANLGASSVVGAAPAQSTQSLWVLRAGHELGASVPKQRVALLLGCVLGGIVAVPTYHLLTNAYGLGSARLPAPSAQVWRSMAEVVSGGAGVPRDLGAVVIVALLVGLGLAAVESRRVARWLPSPTALGIGFVMPAFYASAILIGALAAAAAVRRRPAWSDKVPVVAAGLMAGEALVGVVVALLITLGLLHR
jgi:putative OPT family oligopeptide transporter